MDFILGFLRYFHSNAPFLQAYARPRTNIIRKNKILKSPAAPSSRAMTATETGTPSPLQTSETGWQTSSNLPETASMIYRGWEYHIRTAPFSAHCTNGGAIALDNAMTIPTKAIAVSKTTTNKVKFINPIRF